MSGNGDSELIEEPLLLWRGLGHATEPDLSTIGGRQDDVGALERRKTRQALRRRQAGAAAMEQLFQGDPQRVPEKTRPGDAP